MLVSSFLAELLYTLDLTYLFIPTWLKRTDFQPEQVFHLSQSLVIFRLCNLNSIVATYLVHKTFSDQSNSYKELTVTVSHI